MLSIVVSGLVTLAHAQNMVTRALPYPSAPFTHPEDGRAIADQVYFVNHFFALKNFSWEDQGERIAVLINKRPAYKPTTNTRSSATSIAIIPMAKFVRWISPSSAPANSTAPGF